MKSSTHAELVGVSDYLPQTIWVTHFMRAQGYLPLENFLEQDNESAIKLATNGRTSAGSKSRHLDIRYFWIKENLETMGISVRHCRTLKMLGDFFTKPQQGTLFRTMRDVTLGKLPISALDLFLDSYPDLDVEERVENLRLIGRDTDNGDTVEVNTKKNDDVKENIEPDGFILVKGKKKRTGTYVEKISTNSEQNLTKSKKIVSWLLS